jgi:hypothetical protein
VRSATEDRPVVGFQADRTIAFRLRYDGALFSSGSASMVTASKTGVGKYRVVLLEAMDITGAFATVDAAPNYKQYATAAFVDGTTTVDIQVFDDTGTAQENNNISVEITGRRVKRL